MSSTTRLSAPSSQPTKNLFPFLDLKAQYAQIRDQVSSAVTKVLESQQFIMGPEVGQLEEELKPYVGCKHVFGCASGSDALLLALMALEVGPGDEVIAPAFTFVATAGSISRLGARPVFVDIDPVTYNLDPKLIENKINKKTKAIIPVHLFGLAADMNAILQVAQRHHVPVIEDAAQAIGAHYNGKPVGSMGTFGCFSFFPSKNLGGAGDGGLVTTNDENLADRLKVLRLHGSRHKYQYELLGMNSRLDTLQAAILRVKLQYLEGWSEGRRKNAARYAELFRQHGLTEVVQAPVTPAGCTHVYNQFTIRTKKRDELKDHLKQCGIPTEIYYPYPLHLQPAFTNLGHRVGDLPVTEAVSAEVLSLPIYAELKDEQLQTVVKHMGEFFGV